MRSCRGPDWSTTTWSAASGTDRSRSTPPPRPPPARGEGERTLLGPGSHGFRLEFAVHVDGVDLLVVEAQEILDLRALGDRRRITPNDVGEFLAGDIDRPVGGLALVGTTCRRVRGRQQVQSHVQLGNVVAGRQAGLDQEPRPGALGDDLPAHDYLHAPAAVS